MRISKIIKPIAFILIFCLINMLLTFLLSPGDGASSRMWKEFREYDNIDMIFNGSSYTQKGFNPYTVDEILGTNSFNMGTPEQGLDVTYEAIKTAIETQKIKTVVISLSAYTLGGEMNDNACMTFLRARKDGMTFIDKVKADLAFVFDADNFGKEKSINYFVPWVYNQIQWNKEDFITNWNVKVHGYVQDDGVTEYIGKGYECNYRRLSYLTAVDKNSAMLHVEVNDESYDKMRAICQLCNDNGIELFFINTPKAVYDVLSFGEDYYFEVDEGIRGVCQEYGATYYDFNLAKPELFENRKEYLADFEHLNEIGAEVFTKAFCDLYLDCKTGKKSAEEIQLLFYNREEYDAIMKPIGEKILKQAEEGIEYDY